MAVPASCKSSAGESACFSARRESVEQLETADAPSASSCPSLCSAGGRSSPPHLHPSVVHLSPSFLPSPHPLRARCTLALRRTAPQRFLCRHFASSLIYLTLPSFFHPLRHTHTHTLALTHADLFILCTLCLAGTPPACGATSPPLPLLLLLLLLLRLSGSATSIASPPILRPLSSLRAVNPKQAVVLVWRGRGAARTAEGG